MATYDWDRIRSNIFAGESGGDYNALFGYSNRPGGQFEGTRLTDMTVDQALSFADPSGPYGQWVKGKVGRVATPMGAYQIVGSTLRDAKRGLGLRGDEVMTPELQERLGRWIYETQGTGAWEGYRPNAGAQAIAADTMRALGKGPQMEQMTPAAPQQDERKGFLGGLLGDPERRAKLAMMLEGMTLNPNQGVIEAAKSTLAEGARRRETNKTIEMLQRMGADPKLIELAQAGYAKEAIGLAYAKPKEPKIFEMGGRLVRYDPTTGATTEVYSSGPDTKAISDARKEFTSQGWVKAFADQGDAYAKIIKSIEDPSPSGDLALIFNFMKVLDPGSVVREGEFATAANAGSVDERVRGLYNRVISGERLTPEQRADFATRATQLYQGASEIYQRRADQYAGFAAKVGLPVDQVIPDFSYGDELYKKPLRFQRPPPPKGVTQDEWVTAWEAMTDAERAEFLNGGQP